MYTTGIFSGKSYNSKSETGFQKWRLRNQENDMPVATMPVFSKTLERIIYNRILNSCTKSNLLFLEQFGFGQTIKHITLF